MPVRVWHCKRPSATLTHCLAACVWLLTAHMAWAASLPGPLVTVEWLDRHRDQVRVLDVRAALGSFTSPPRYYTDRHTGDTYLLEVGGHIPGSVLVDFATLRASRTVDGRKVDKLIAPPQAFTQLMQSYGVNRESAVVIVTRGESADDITLGTRLYWQLKYYGHDRVALLDGGVAKWLLSGRTVVTDWKPPKAGNWTVTAERRELLASSADVARAMAEGGAQLMDNRPVSQYLGTAKAGYVAAPGHIPGAKVFPTELLTEPAAPASFLAEPTLRKLVEQMGLDPQRPTITYCNSGHLASGGWFVLSELLGNKDAKLYDGSMHEWTLEQRPVRYLEME